MFKTIFNMLAGALIVTGIGAAFAVGNVPQPGFGAIDGDWLLGLANGRNRSYQYNISAAGTTQATATQLPSDVSLIEVDTAAASSGVNLPLCRQGTILSLYNNGAQTLTVYPQVNNNPATGAQDTINSGTTLSGGMATHTAELFFCAKNGNWAAK